MGADLYSDSIVDPAREKWTPAFEKACSEREKVQKKLEKLGVDFWKDEKFKKVQAKIDEAYGNMYPDEGYFRDSYNCSSVLARLELSWWKDVIPMLDKEGKLVGPKIKELVEMIESRELKLVDAEEYAEKFRNPEDSADDWNKYFIQKKQNLLKFLNGALQDNDSISCSL